MSSFMFFRLRTEWYSLESALFAFYCDMLKSHIYLRAWSSLSVLPPGLEEIQEVQYLHLDTSSILSNKNSLQSKIGQGLFITN